MSAIRPVSLAVVSPTVAARVAQRAPAERGFTTEAEFLAAEQEEAEWNGQCAAARHRIEAESDRRRYAAAMATEAARRADPRVPVELYCTVG